MGHSAAVAIVTRRSGRGRSSALLPPTPTRHPLLGKQYWLLYLGLVSEISYLIQVSELDKTNGRECKETGEDPEHLDPAAKA